MSYLSTCRTCGRITRIEDQAGPAKGGDLPDGWECPDYPHKEPAPMAKTYNGHRAASGCIVTVAPDAGAVYYLPPRNDVRNHSPDGFEWGYGGSGPAQLALALCIDHLGGDVERAQRVYHGVKFALIGPIRGDVWALTTDQLEDAIAKIEGARERVTGEP